MSIIIELEGGGFLLIQQPANSNSSSQASRWKLIVHRRMYQDEIYFARLPPKGIPEFNWLSRYLSTYELRMKQGEIAATFDLLRQFYPDGQTLLKGAEGLAKRGKQ